VKEQAEGEQRAAELFARTFGAPPTVVASAPGRVNLIGEHLDYNGGDVLPIAIALRTYVAARENGGATVRAVSASESEAGEFPVREARAEGRWWDYVAGTAMQLAARGAAVRGADLAVWSDIPGGAGLASSAALEIAAGLALVASARGDARSLRPALPQLAWQAETEFVGVGVGVMDQIASACARDGCALHIEIRGKEWSAGEIPFRESVLVFDTGVRRSLRDGRFNARREECARALALLRRIRPSLPNLAEASATLLAEAALPAPLDARARHVATEAERVDRTVDALIAGAPFPAELMYASHASLRDDYECSCAELDWFVERARRDGLRGARMTGAGWGGCAIAVDAREKLEAAAPAIAEEYRAVHGRTPQWWITRASHGAGFSPYPHR